MLAGHGQTEQPFLAANLQQGQHCVGLLHEHLTFIILFLHQDLLLQMSLGKEKRSLLASKHLTLSGGLLVKVNELRGSPSAVHTFDDPTLMTSDPCLKKVECFYCLVLMTHLTPFGGACVCVSV